jgi:small subunit ribosomal protein S3
MGQKVHPTGIRLGIVRDWNSKWFATHDYANKLCVDLKVREFLKKTLEKAGISRIKIERPAQNAHIIIFAARPGTIIGKKGNEVDELRKQVSKMMGVPVHIDIEEVRRPEMDAQLVAENIAQQLEKRVMFRRAMKRAISGAQRAGAEGIKVQASGRLAGAEIARTEGYREGRVPLQTFRTDIDFGFAEAKTTYGIIGVKVWISKGEVLGKNNETETQAKKSQGGKSKNMAEAA